MKKIALSTSQNMHSYCCIPTTCIVLLYVCMMLAGHMLVEALQICGVYIAYMAEPCVHVSCTNELFHDILALIPVTRHIVCCSQHHWSVPSLMAQTKWSKNLTLRVNNSLQSLAYDTVCEAHKMVVHIATVCWAQICI